MSEPEPELDESLRGKLLSLGEAVDPPLGTEAEQRIVARLQLEAARQRSRSKRLRWGTGTGMLAAAASLWLIWSSRTPDDRAAQPAPTCAWGDAPLTFVASREGTRELALGAAGHIVLAEGAEAVVKQGAACALGVELVRGSLAAELGDLRPGSLKVRTNLGDVQVRGTTFSVDVEDGLHVVLLSGAVELLDDGTVTLKMAPGKALHRSARRTPPALSDASAEDARQVARLLRPARSQAPESTRAHEAPTGDSPPHADEPSRATPPGRSMGLLGEAEAARKQGHSQRARALYGQAARANHADAEVALLRHAGFEIEASDPAAAEQLLAEHRRRFPRSRLAAEAAWLGVRAIQVEGDRTAMREAARELIRRFAETPQARAAQRLLDQP